MRFSMADFWSSASLQSLEMMAADTSKGPVLAMISAGDCPFSKERMSLPMVRHALIVTSYLRLSTLSSNVST